MPSVSPASSGSSTIPQKRPRPVKSCLSCRNRKLKCDREQPCSQCIRSRRGDLCAYDERAGSLGQYSNASTPHSLRSNGDSVISVPTGIDGATSGAERSRSDDIRERSAHVQLSESSDQERRALSSSILNPLTHHDTTAVLASAPKKYFGLSNTRSLIALVCTGPNFTMCYP
jgi:Fungal Zn(2)-Cys(6) binuclear cluster domain